jgi:hypothetical protein
VDGAEERQRQELQRRRRGKLVGQRPGPCSSPLTTPLGGLSGCALELEQLAIPGVLDLKGRVLDPELLAQELLSSLDPF